MDQKIDNRLKGLNVGGDYVGGNQIKNYYISTFQDSEREFVVTHNANIKPVSYFTGRETELQELRQRIEAGCKSVLVSGMGGIGKTHICRKLFEEYLKKHDENCPFRHIGYIEYDRDLNNSLQDCLKFKKQEHPEHNLEAAWKELEYLASDGKLLLFVDNVNVSVGEDPSLERLMSIPGTIVLTSRRRTFSKEFEPYWIGFLSTEQCRKIYERILENKVVEDEVPDLVYIIDMLVARHTITIEFLAHLAKTKQWTIQRLRDELEKSGFLLEYKDEKDELVNIQKSYEILYDMSALTKAEKNILEAFSIFPYIPLKAEICNQWLLVDAGVNEEEDTLMGLYRKGWLQFNDEHESYSLHPVFAQFIFDKCKPALENHLGLIFSCQSSLEIPENGSVLECRQFIPFAKNMIEKWDMEEDVEQVEFVFSLADILQYTSEYQKAEELLIKNLSIRKRILGEENADTATSYHNLAFYYKHQGKYEKAEELYRKSIEIREKVLGKDHLDTAISYGNLASIYHTWKEYEKAEDLYEKSLHIREKVLGENDLHTAIGYNNLAGLYDDQGKHEQAEELYKKSLRIREEVLGEEHPDTAIAYHNLAVMYGKQGKYDKAEELHKKSLRIRIEKLGEEHPYVTISYNNLASVYMDKREYMKAEEMYKKSLQIREKVYEKDHPYIATAYRNLANAYVHQGEYNKAQELYEKSLMIYESMLGRESHSDTEIATVCSNLAKTYVRQGEYGKAQELYEKCLLIRERVLEKGHPSTAKSYNNLAHVYDCQGEHQKALAYYVVAFKMLAHKLGLKHPNTQAIYGNLLAAYYTWNLGGDFDQWLEEKMKE